MHRNFKTKQHYIWFENYNWSQRKRESQQIHKLSCSIRGIAPSIDRCPKIHPKSQTLTSIPFYYLLTPKRIANEDENSQKWFQIRVIYKRNSQPPRTAPYSFRTRGGPLTQRAQIFTRQKCKVFSPSSLIVFNYLAIMLLSGSLRYVMVRYVTLRYVMLCYVKRYVTLLFATHNLFQYAVIGPP